MNYWYQSKPLRKRIGHITDVFALGYVELKDMETGHYVIRKFSELELIQKV